VEVALRVSDQSAKDNADCGRRHALNIGISQQSQPLSEDSVRSVLEKRRRDCTKFRPDLESRRNIFARREAQSQPFVIVPSMRFGPLVQPAMALVPP
jgi:hypothetical protein